MNELSEEHPFKPFVPKNARILIIGSFPGMDQVKNKANSEEWFYTAKDNQFWTIISAVYENKLLTTESKKMLFEKEGIGITDIFLKIKRKVKSNLDKHLIVVEYNDQEIKAILESGKFDLILFTSRYVEKHFKIKFPEVSNSIALPSPSGAANIPISKTEAYKKFIRENPEGNTKTFRIVKYREFLKG